MTMKPYLLMLTAWLCWAAAADAGNLAHYDLASLSFISRSIVLVDEVSHQSRIEAWNKTTIYKVIKAYQGPLKIGQQVEVYDEAESPSSTGKQRAVLFISPAEPREIKPGKPLLRGLYEAAPSGWRFLVEGMVYRVEQQNNPGPYEPVPQGKDPLDVRGLERPNASFKTQPISFADFEKALTTAIHLADQVKKTFRLPDSAQRNAALLQLLPAPRSFPAPLRYTRRQYADPLSLAIQERILQSEDLESFIEAMGRNVDGEFDAFRPSGLFSQDGQKRAEFLFSVAADEKRPLHQRDAAVQLIRNLTIGHRRMPANGAFNSETLCQALGGFLTAKDRAVRIAAVKVLPDSKLCQRDKALKKLLSAVGTEKDGLVLLALHRELWEPELEAAFWASLSNPADRELIFVPLKGPAAGLTTTALDLGFAVAGPMARDGTQTLEATITAQDGTSQSASAAQEIWSFGHKSHFEALARFKLKTPLRKGSYQVEILLRIERGSEQGPRTIERKGTLTVEIP